MGKMTFGPKSTLKKEAKIAKQVVEQTISTVVAPAVVYVDKIVEVETIKEVPTTVIQYIDKEVIKYVEVPIEKIVERIVEVEKHIVTEIEKPIEIIKEIPTYLDRIVVKVEDRIPRMVFAIIGIETLVIIVLLAKLI